jgi:transcriptional regulator with XRE-family HTH domain
MQSLQDYMYENRMSFKELGTALGVSRGYAHRLVSGERTPTVNTLRRIHEVTGIPLKTLVYECT